jgi:hypothetical protein
VCLLIGYEVLNGGLIGADAAMLTGGSDGADAATLIGGLVGADAATLNNSSDYDNFKTDTYFISSMMIVAVLTTIGALQLLMYMMDILKALRTLIRHSWRKRNQLSRLEVEPAPEVGADIQQADDGADAQLRHRGGGGHAKFIGITDVNTIRNRNGRPRTHDKKMHNDIHCRALLASQSPLTGIIKVSLSPDGLCRCCHSEEERQTAATQ